MSPAKTTSQNVVYKGPARLPRGAGDVGAFQIDDAEGNPHVLWRDVVYEAPAELAKELLSGEDRVAGEKFEEAPEGVQPGHRVDAAERIAAERAALAAAPDEGPPEPEGATNVGGGGTAAASART